jgi:thiosulfate reductase cytochrome b subunit
MSHAESAGNVLVQRPIEPLLDEQRHSLIVRIAHWCQALAIVIMIGSGWRIYDNVPIFPFEFPYWITLGGDKYLATTTSNDWGTGNAIAWHFAGMWLLLFGFGLFVLNGVLTISGAICCRLRRVRFCAISLLRPPSSWDIGWANTTRCRKRSTGG